MIQETRNYGRAGGRLRYDHSIRDAALMLTREACEDDLERWDKERWTIEQVQVWIWLGIDEAEFHANWGV